MENTMRHFMVLLSLVLLGGTDLPAQEIVEARGVTSEVKIEDVIFGHLTELNGKFKLRATELTFAPDGYIGVHHHIGPGIRYVISGELTFAEGGQETIYKAGEYFFETGNIAHTAQNKTNVPLRILVVEILPKDWATPAMTERQRDRDDLHWSRVDRQAPRAAQGGYPVGRPHRRAVASRSLQRLYDGADAARNRGCRPHAGTGAANAGGARSWRFRRGIRRNAPR